MSSLSSLVEFRNGELFLFGNKVNRHSEMPWLFSATDMHKACKSPIHSSAKKKGKEPSVYFHSKQPSQWLKRNLLNDEERIAKVAGRLREKIKEYGPGMGLVEMDKESKLTAVALLSSLSDLESIVYTKRGGAKGTAGTYISLELLRDYATFFSIPELSEDFHKLFPSSSEEITSTVNKLSSTRKELEFSKYLLGLADVLNLQLTTQHREGTYLVDFLLDSSRGLIFIEFDEDHHDYQVEEDKERWEWIQRRYTKNKKRTKPCFFFRVSEGEEYRFVFDLHRFLVTGKTSQLPAFVYLPVVSK